MSLNSDSCADWSPRKVLLHIKHRNKIVKPEEIFNRTCIFYIMIKGETSFHFSVYLANHEYNGEETAPTHLLLNKLHLG